MSSPEETPGFFGYLLEADYRFLQERDLGFDLYNSGYCGLLVCVFAVAAATIFFLSIFHLIPQRKHVTLLLLGTGGLSLAFGLLGSWLNYSRIAEAGERLFSTVGGAAPATTGQEAAIMALPLATGCACLLASLAGYLYLVAFWTSDLLRADGEASRPKKGRKQKVKTPAGK
jgi:hypothetical protein